MVGHAGLDVLMVLVEGVEAVRVLFVGGDVPFFDVFERAHVLLEGAGGLGGRGY